jgi:uncharacterized protein involved in exopolysaccharide biosynthesis
VIDMFNARRRLGIARTLGWAAGVAVLVALVSFLLPKRYVSEGSFLPDLGDNGSLPSSLISLATKLNMGGLQTGSRGPEFYGDLVVSRSVLSQLAMSRIAGKDSTLTPVEWYGYSSDTLPQAISETQRALDEHIRVRVNRITGVVTVGFDSADPVFSAAVVNRIIEIVNDFNLLTYRSRARARREFTESRLSQVGDQLRRMEDAWSQFNKRNRMIAGSPELQLDADRLQRSLRLQEQLFIQLNQSLEEARIEEVRDTPVLTIVDNAVAPIRPTFPRPLLFGFLAFVTVLTIKVGAGILRPGTTTESGEEHGAANRGKE